MLSCFTYELLGYLTLALLTCLTVDLNLFSRLWILDELNKMLLKSKFKLATAIGIVLSVLSLLVHLFLANYSAGGISKYSVRTDDVLPVGPVSCKS
jgi:hypothetical protein